MKKRAFPLSKVYQLLEPGPVVLMSTAGKKPNVMAMSWHMMMEFEPPTVACILGGQSYSFELLRRTKECVLNIPTREIAEKVVRCGNVSGRKIDKFKAFGLTAVPAKDVAAPLVDECYANLECRVVDTSQVAKYCLFVLEVRRAWIDPSRKNPKTLHHRGQGVFFSPGTPFRLRSNMK